VLAAIVRLLEGTLIRIGNREYSRNNGSFGLTTLLADHLEIDSEKMRFTFRGKSGKVHDITYRDRRLARLIKAIHDLPGQTLFQYVEESGEPSEVTSEHVNAYLREASGTDFTAKEFRTWAATVEAVRLRLEGETDRPRITKAVAARLGNTPAVCRKSYIHPRAWEWDLPEKLPRQGKWLDSVERLVLDLLRKDGI
jgi:DNA topoisomerase-1